MNKRFLLVAVIVILLTLASRLLVFQHGLPYIENLDETNMYILSNSSIGRIDGGWRVDWLRGYPPGYIWFSGQFMSLMDRLRYPNIYDINTDMGRYIVTLRLASILADVVTVATVLALARALGGTGAATLAGMIWVLSPPIIYDASIALPDVFAVMFCGLCGWASWRAWRDDKPLWLLGAVICGLLAVVFKYPAAPVLAAPGLEVLVLVWRKRRRWWLLVVSGGLVLAAAYGLLVGYGAENLDNREAVAVRTNPVNNLLNPLRLEHAFNSVEWSVGAVFLVLAGAALVVMVIRRRRYLPLLATLGVGALLWLLVPIYSDVTLEFYAPRYTWPAVLFVVVAGAAALTQATRKWRWQPILLVLPVVGLLPGTAARISDLQRPDTRTLAQTWMEANVPDKADVWTPGYRNWEVLNRTEGGYSGFKQFNVTEAEDKALKLDADKPAFLFVDADDIAAWQQQTDYPPLDDFTLLKTIGGDNLRGPMEAIYLMQAPPSPDMAHEFPMEIGDIVLRQADVRQVGKQITIHSLWQASALPEQDYSYFVHISPVGDPQTLVAQQDGQLGSRPTSTWTDARETMIFDLPPVDISKLTPGDYTVYLGVYFWETPAPLGQVAIMALHVAS